MHLRPCCFHLRVLGLQGQTEFCSLCWSQRGCLLPGCLPQHNPGTPTSPFRRRGSQLVAPLCAILFSAAMPISPRASFSVLKLTFEAYRSAGLSLADVGLGSVLLSVAICSYLGVPPTWTLMEQMHDFVLATQNSSSDGAQMSVLL